MMNKHELSILFKMGVEDVKVMQKDFILLKNKVKIFYVVDTYDVIEFCFPTLTNISEQVESSIATSFLAYNFFFFHNKNKPVILNEYKVELFGIWNEVHREANNLMDNRSREAEMELIKAKLKKDKENLGRNIGLLLSLSLGFLSESALLQYKRVLNERLQIDRFETENEDDRLILEEIFNSTFSTRKVSELFEDFCHESRLLISGKSDKDRYAYLENAFRDIVVFERIVNINNAIQKRKDLKEKYVFLYMSSTPKQSVKIASLFAKAGRLTDIYEYLNYPILRNISQFYLGELIEGSTEENNQSDKFKQEQLNKCLEILEHGDSRDRLAEKLADTLYNEINIFNDKINLNRNELENTYLLCNSYYAYRNRILSAIESKEELFDFEMRGIVIDLFAELDKNKNENSRVLLTLSNYKEEFVFQSKIMRYLTAVREHKNIIKLMPGLDPVRSYVQLYPVLLFYPYLGKQSFSPLLNFFTDVIKPHLNDMNIKPYRASGLKRMDVFTLDSYERRLYYLFLDLVIPDEESRNGRWKNEQELILNLQKLYLINSKRNARFTYSDNKGSMDVFLFPQREFEIEVVYFISWLYRRARLYADALEYVNKIIDSFEFSDPRLLHSRALSYISLIYENRKSPKSEMLIWINQALKDLTHALTRFESDYKQTANELLMHVIIGIKNTKCDLQTKLFDTDNTRHANIITNETRPMLNSFKHDLKGLNEDYAEYHTYNHTEVDLEYCEALIALTSGNMEEAKRKILIAKNRYDLIVDSEMLNEYIYLSDTGKKVLDLFFELHNV